MQVSKCAGEQERARGLAIPASGFIDVLPRLIVLAGPTGVAIPQFGWPLVAAVADAGVPLHAANELFVCLLRGRRRRRRGRAALLAGRLRKNASAGEERRPGKNDKRFPRHDVLRRRGR